jgi:uncharacterized LabA/DUF88 family protein
VADERLKIAVFIDFDNIEIGVRNSLSAHFDVGAVLEAVKERGEVVTKVAYGDWTRATDYGRSMSQHAVHMVQRNMTPGGDKNGADITLALDALEMAFTHNHINAFVIVGGDSDFITLVEKLKQYDRKVFVVGGRSFTSQVMQKNCTEFVAYEDICGGSGRGRQEGGRTRPVTNSAAAMPLIRRAIKLLADREMTPNLGLLKSTLLQLDSSFSERAYGTGSFRDFIEKLAKAGHLTVKGADRSFYVELREVGEAADPRAHDEPREAATRPPHTRGRDAHHATLPDNGASERADDAAGVPVSAPVSASAAGAEDAARLGPAEGLRAMIQAFSRVEAKPRFPMYVRQVRHFMKGFDEGFDERRYGFAGILDALRFGQREGLFRLERDRQGGVRVHAGTQYQQLTQTSGAAPLPDASAAGERPQDATPPPGAEAEVGASMQGTPLTPVQPPAASEPPPVESDAIPSARHAAAPTKSEDVPAAQSAPAPRAAARKRAAAGTRAAPRTRKAATPAAAAKKKPARPRAKKA